MSTRYGYVSTYPPTQCGLATFTAALRGAMLSGGADQGPVIRLVDAPSPGPVDDVTAELVSGDADSLSRASLLLNGCDVAIIQHEYGVYGGPDGEEVLDLLDQTRVPTVVVLHTVLADPTPHQRLVLEQVSQKADAVVTMTESAHSRLVDRYSVDMAKSSIIGHGAPNRPAAHEHSTDAGPVTILTWGLLGPGKGIEWAIEAMALLRDLDPMPHYLIAGQTHPKVLAHEGETYRNRLQQQVRQRRLEPFVAFDGRYLDAAALARVVDEADIVLLPYDSTDQVTSGVLIEAVAAGKPVIATCFPHAQELLATGAGVVVPHRDPPAIAAALRTVLTHVEVAESMASAAARTAPQLLWPSIAAEYRELVQRLISARVAA